MAQLSDFGLACRLTGFLDRDVEVKTHRTTCLGRGIEFTIHKIIDLGNSRRCLLITIPSTETLYVCFSWYAPRSVFDYMYGLSMLQDQVLYDHCNKAFYFAANEYLSNSDFFDLFIELVGVSTEIVLTGFSMGGATAACMAYLLKTQHGFTRELTVYAMGCPRVGDQHFSQWFERSVSPKSGCLVAAYPPDDERPRELAFDPVCVSPLTTEGFVNNPKLSVLVIGESQCILRKASQIDNLQLERQEITCGRQKGAPTEGVLSALGSILGVTQQSEYDIYYDKLHKILEYYTGLVNCKS